MISLILILLILNILIINFHDKLKFLNIPYDVPDNVRKFHKDNVLISGGIILLTNILISLLFFYFFKNPFVEILFNGSLLFFVYFILVLIFFYIGFIDDKNNINPNVKLIILAILFTLLVYSNDIFVIKSIKLSFTDHIINLKYLSHIFTVVCLLLFINAINMYDGINIQSFSYIISIVIYFLVNNIFSEFLIYLSIPILAYGYLNFKNKSFLGDSGCYVISFIFGSIFIASYNLEYILYADTIFLLMILPGLDMLRLFIFRVLKRKNPFKADRDHIHHRLLSYLEYRKTIIILIFFQFSILYLLIIGLNNLILFSIILIFYLLLIFLPKNILKV